VDSSCKEFRSRVTKLFILLFNINFGIRPDGHQAILFRFTHNLAGAAGHGSLAQRVPSSAVRIPPGSYQIQQNQSVRFGVGIWCAGRNVRSRVTKYICSAPPPNLLSVLDPGSLASGIAALFESLTQAKIVCSLRRTN
jgi:hypothetical protein